MTALHVYAIAKRMVVAVSVEQATELLGPGAEQLPDDQFIDIFVADDEACPESAERLDPYVRATAKAWADFNGKPCFLADPITKADIAQLANEWEQIDPEYAAELRSILS